MSKTYALGGLAATVVLALIVATVAIGTFGVQVPQTNRVAYPTYVQSVPDGCRPVAPGAHSTICDGVALTVSQPGNGSSDLDCHPVAPGAFSQICVKHGSSDAPIQPAPDKPSGIGCHPVAPGAFSEICRWP